MDNDFINLQYIINRKVLTNFNFYISMLIYTVITCSTVMIYKNIIIHNSFFDFIMLYSPLTLIPLCIVIDYIVLGVIRIHDYERLGRINKILKKILITILIVLFLLIFVDFINYSRSYTKSDSCAIMCPISPISKLIGSIFIYVILVPIFIAVMYGMSAVVVWLKSKLVRKVPTKIHVPKPIVITLKIFLVLVICYLEKTLFSNLYDIDSYGQIDYFPKIFSLYISIFVVGFVIIFLILLKFILKHKLAVFTLLSLAILFKAIMIFTSGTGIVPFSEVEYFKMDSNGYTSSIMFHDCNVLSYDTYIMTTGEADPGTYYTYNKLTKKIRVYPYQFLLYGYYSTYEIRVIEYSKDKIVLEEDGVVRTYLSEEKYKAKYNIEDIY